MAVTNADPRLEFITTTDALKHIERANRTHSGTRQENVAEHVWHATLMAMVFADAAPEGTDHDHVRDLLTAHDLVEIFAGDTVIWDNVAAADQFAREAKAAEQLFATLPDALRQQFTALWQEFDAQETVEARFARAIDALHPMVMSWGPGSIGHPNPDLRPAMVLARKAPMIEAFPDLWTVAQDLVRSAVERGLLADDE